MERGIYTYHMAGHIRMTYVDPVSLVDEHRSLGPKPNNWDVDQVRDLLHLKGDGWNHELLSSLFQHDIATKIAAAKELILDSCLAELEIFMMILWGLWTRRNKHFHGQLNGREGNVETIARLVLSEHHKANQREIISTLHNTHRGVWLRPEIDVIKFCGYASSPLEAEAKVVHWAMTHALSRGYSRVIFESNSLCLVKALNNKVILLQVASLFSDILSYSLAFDVCCWSFVKRVGNRVAHSIANLALSCSCESILDGGVPSCVNAWVIKDVLSSNME
ncbi:reverse transcriptase [Tanacetum coccineum]